MFSFQGAFLELLIPKRLNEISTSIGISVNLFYSLSYIFFKWWAKIDSNHRPHDYQSCALASWAIGPSSKSNSLIPFPSSAFRLPKTSYRSFASPLKLKPASLGFQFVLSYDVVVWWRLAGSNRWPPACKAGALPAELNPHIVDTFPLCLLSTSLYPLNWIT